ncbi:MAG TPA: MOSC domain-containing protein [Trichocoleus sp.]|jgi:uncharacterized protein YcbX
MSNPLVTGIYLYPVKSCRGIAVSASDLTTWGLQWDRNWMVVTPQGRFLTQRELPQMALIETRIAPDALELSAPEMPRLRVPLTLEATESLDVVVWGDACQAIDQGEAAAQWFSQFLGRACRLVRIGEAYQRLVDPTYSSEAAQVSFADGYPLLIISEASLADLNQRLAEPLPMNRFRPNLVVSGCDAYAEDRWQTIEINGVQFDGVKLCTRCAITTTSQETGVRGVEPLPTLATYRQVKKGVIFGQNLVHRGLGQLTVGSEVKILR